MSPLGRPKGELRSAQHEASQAGPSPATMAADVLATDLDAQPGHLIRRAQQIAVAMFAEALGRDVTPVQYAVLRTLQDWPGIDQVTLAREVALDNSTTADIAARLETKGWILREVLPRRQRALRLTADGAAMLAGLAPGLHAMNAALLSRLDAPEQVEFMRLLRKFVQLNNHQSRAPQRKAQRKAQRAD